MRKMFEMQTWQAIVVGAIALACVGYMGVTIAHLLSGTSDATGSVRPATSFESALADGEAPAGAFAADGFSYRVGARFAGKVRVVVDDGTVSVSGPRVPRGIYVFWIWVQGLLLAFAPVALVLAAVKLDWRALLLAVATLVVSFGISSLGAGLWPGLGEMQFMTNGVHDAVEFPVSSVDDVRVGDGWASGGLEVVLLPYKGAIDQLAVDHAVSWSAPDGDGRLARYAVHVHDQQQAADLAAQLGGE